MDLSRRAALAQIGALTVAGCATTQESRPSDLPPLQAADSPPKPSSPDKPSPAPASSEAASIRLWNLASASWAQRFAIDQAERLPMSIEERDRGTVLGGLLSRLVGSRNVTDRALAGAVVGGMTWDSTVPSLSDPTPPPSWLVTRHPALAAPAAQIAPLKRVAGCVCRSLIECGYPEPRFFRYRDGFAAMTVAERIADDGSSWPGRGRFVEGANEIPWWNLVELARRLVLPAETYWRVFAFTVSGEPSAAAEPPPAGATSLNDMTKRYQAGSVAPPSTAQARGSRRKALLIYEFGGRQGSPPTLLRPGLLPPAQHLAKTGILDQLSTEFTKLG
jgi:hypothetical protein